LSVRGPRAPRALLAGGGGEDAAPDVSLRRRIGRSRPNPGRWRSPTL